MLRSSRDVPLRRTLRPLPPGTKVIEFKALVVESNDIKEWIGRTNIDSNDKPC